MEKIQVAVAGYGNLGKGVIANLNNFPDFTFSGVFSRRNIETGFPVYSYADAPKLKDKIDVVILCGGSATDLPVQTPEMARYFNVVDSFDTHAKIPEHVEKVGAAATEAGTLAAVSVGWDPGLFSLQRLLFASVLPDGADYTLWGKGVSQGHSDAIRRIAGVKKAVQYTIPKETALNKIRGEGTAALSTKEKHLRECFVVAEPDADKALIERKIVTMPNYFADYDTVVHFIGDDEYDRTHTALPHGGFVLRKGNTGGPARHLLEFSIKLDSNPEFTSSVLLAYARAVSRLSKEGKTGCLTVFDIPYSYLFAGGTNEAVKRFL